MMSFRKPYVCVFVVAIVTLIPLESVRSEEIPSAIAVLRHIVQAREAIKNGHVSVESRTQIQGMTETTQQWEIYFDGSKLRSDIKRGASTETVCLDCYSKYTRLYYTSAEPTLAGMQNALTFYDGYGEPGPILGIPNLPWMGYFPYSFAQSIYAQTAFVYEYDYEKNGYKLQISPDILEGRECWKVIFPSPLNSGQSIVTIWVDKVVYEHVYRVETHLPVQIGNNIDYVDRIELHGEMIQGKYWFPTRTFYQRFENGTLERSSETTTIVHSLNKPLPPEMFSPKSIVKPDTPVAWHLDRDRPVPEGELIWNGNDVVSEDAFGKMMAESVRFKPINLFFMLLGVALILLGIGLKLWKKYGK